MANPRKTISRTSHPDILLAENYLSTHVSFVERTNTNIYYWIDVETGESSWTVKRRDREFKSLNRILRKRYPRSQVPLRVGDGSGTVNRAFRKALGMEQYYDKKRLAFNDYLQDLLQLPEIRMSEELEHFLAVETLFDLSEQDSDSHEDVTEKKNDDNEKDLSATSLPERFGIVKRKSLGFSRHSTKTAVKLLIDELLESEVSGIEEKKIRVRRSFEESIEIYMNEKYACVVLWKFETAAKDIGFSVHVTPGGKEDKSKKDGVEVKKYYRAQCHRKPTYGRFIIGSASRFSFGNEEMPEKVTVTLRWDNSYSKLRSKNLTYVLTSVSWDDWAAATLASDELCGKVNTREADMYEAEDSVNEMEKKNDNFFSSQKSKKPATVLPINPFAKDNVNSNSNKNPFSSSQDKVNNNPFASSVKKEEKKAGNNETVKVKGNGEVEESTQVQLLLQKEKDFANAKVTSLTAEVMNLKATVKTLSEALNKAKEAEKRASVAAQNLEEELLQNKQKANEMNEAMKEEIHSLSNRISELSLTVENLTLERNEQKEAIAFADREKETRLEEQQLLEARVYKLHREKKVLVREIRKLRGIQSPNAAAATKIVKKRQGKEVTISDQTSEMSNQSSPRAALTSMESSQVTESTVVASASARSHRRRSKESSTIDLPLPSSPPSSSTRTSISTTAASSSYPIEIASSKKEKHSNQASFKAFSAVAKAASSSLKPLKAAATAASSSFQPLKKAAAAAASSFPSFPSSPPSAFPLQTPSSSLPNKQKNRIDYRHKLIEFYKEHNPSKLSSVDTLLNQYSGRERSLFAALYKKYGKNNSPVRRNRSISPRRSSVVRAKGFTSKMNILLLRLVQGDSIKAKKLGRWLGMVLENDVESLPFLGIEVPEVQQVDAEEFLQKILPEIQFIVGQKDNPCNVHADLINDNQGKNRLRIRVSR